MAPQGKRQFILVNMRPGDRVAVDHVVRVHPVGDGLQLFDVTGHLHLISDPTLVQRAMAILFGTGTEPGEMETK